MDLEDVVPPSPIQDASSQSPSGSQLEGSRGPLSQIRQLSQGRPALAQPLFTSTQLPGRLPPLPTMPELGLDGKYSCSYPSIYFLVAAFSSHLQSNL